MLILVSRQAAAAIGGAGNWGLITLRVNHGEQVAAVVAVSSGEQTPVGVPLDPPNHFLREADPYRSTIWYRAEPELHLSWAQAIARVETAIPLDSFRARIPSGFKQPGTEQLTLTYSHRPEEHYPGLGVPQLAAWAVSREGAAPLPLLVQQQTTDIEQLRGSWPLETLASAHVTLIGAGSIGGAIAHALAGYGLGHLTLVDPDHLAWHNLVRHTSSARQVGRLKVRILAEEITAKYPHTEVTPRPWNVITDAHHARALIAETDLVVGATDGVAARRVISHLARRTSRTAVLACVLHDGAVGEVLRLRPWATHGCLLCRRTTLEQAGGLDPEPSLDAGYGTGELHRPTTAVGPDLHLTGQLAAKAAIATILERDGHPDQRLPGEHAVIGLRRQPDLAAPFDLARTGQVRWLPATPPQPGCPTCEPEQP